MSKISGRFLSIFALIAVSVCAQEGAESEGAPDPATEAEEIALDPNAPPSTEPGCFSVRGVSNFSGFHNEFLYVQGRGNTHFLLTVFRGCLGLRSAQAIAIESHTDRVCSNTQASVTFRGIGGRRESCFITSVEQVEDRAAARAIVDIRTRSQ